MIQFSIDQSEVNISADHALVQPFCWSPLCEEVVLCKERTILKMAEEETPVTEQIEQQNGEEFTENAVEPMEGDESGGGDQAEGGNPEDEDDR